MKASLVSSLFAAAGLLAGGAVLAQDNTFIKAGDNSLVKVPGVDKDGDGCLAKSEVTPGGQLEKRFGTRDTNGDGKLCKDEYYTPG